MSTIFEKASRDKLRFPSRRGEITAEDLWDLPLTSVKGLSLNSTAKLIAANIKENGEEDFVGEGNPQLTKSKLRLDIVKHVIAVRLAENKAKTDAKVNEAHNTEIDNIIASKKSAEMQNMSVEDLEKLKK